MTLVLTPPLSNRTIHFIFFSTLMFDGFPEPCGVCSILLMMFSEVWRGLDRLHQEDPQGYSRIMDQSVKWQQNANSVPEPCKASQILIQICYIF